MTRFVSIAALAIGFAMAWPLAALAQQFSVGQHVLIGSTGETASVIQIGQTTPDGGVMVKVRLNKPGGPTEADREIWYNSRSARVAAAPVNAPRASQQAAPQTPSTAPGAASRTTKDELKVGDRVHIGSLDVNGTVSQIGGKLGNGALMILVEIDRNAPKFPGVAKWYDTISSQITPLN
jgi:hypothetical protein